MSVKRVFVEKKPEFAVQARELCDEIESYLGIAGVTGVRVLVRYDIENLSEDVYREARVRSFPSRRWTRCLKETLSMVQTTPFFLWNTCPVSLTREQTLPSSA